MPRASTAPVCPTHTKAMVKIKGQYYCEDCLYASHLTYETQREAIKRYNKSAEGRKAAKKYEQSDSGKVARERYLKSEKYKQRRKEYNERLRQSLAIARIGLGAGGRGTAVTSAELQRAVSLEGLIGEIREYIDTNYRPPTVKNVIETAKKDYNQTIDEKRAQELVAAAQAGSRRERA